MLEIHKLHVGAKTSHHTAELVVDASDRSDQPWRARGRVMASGNSLASQLDGVVTMPVGIVVISDATRPRLEHSRRGPAYLAQATNGRPSTRTQSGSSNCVPSSSHGAAKYTFCSSSEKHARMRAVRFGNAHWTLHNHTRAGRMVPGSPWLLGRCTASNGRQLSTTVPASRSAGM